MLKKNFKDVLQKTQSNCRLQKTGYIAENPPNTVIYSNNTQMDLSTKFLFLKFELVVSNLCIKPMGLSLLSLSEGKMPADSLHVNVTIM